jgi:hypothetical protein
MQLPAGGDQASGRGCSQRLTQFKQVKYEAKFGSICLTLSNICGVYICSNHLQVMSGPIYIPNPDYPRYHFFYTLLAL